MRLVLATRNAHKVREFAALLAPHELVALPDDVVLPPETGTTFAENALAKARAAAAATGAPAIADDSGIEAAALGGAPGRVLRALRRATTRPTGRTSPSCCARRRPAARSPTSARSRTSTATARARLRGPLHRRARGRPRGDGGFGYDPAFLPDDGPPGRTMAELTDAEKDAISHRGRPRASWSHG